MRPATVFALLALLLIILITGIVLAVQLLSVS